MRRLTGLPSTVADPPVGRTRPRSIAMIVVLPAPLGPIRPATVPDGTANDTWSTATRLPNRLVRRSTTTASSASTDGSTNVGSVAVAVMEPA